MKWTVPKMLARHAILWASVALPAVVHAQFILSTNNGRITIAKYTGSGGAVTIPDTINGLPVILYPMGKAGSSYAILASGTSIGGCAVFSFGSLTNVTLGTNVTCIENSTFDASFRLANVTSIGDGAFSDCSSVTSVIIPRGVTNIENLAFVKCLGLTGVYFKGNAPSLGGDDVFKQSDKIKIYHLPGTTGWSNTFGGRPTAIWKPQTNAPTNAQSK